MTKKTNGSADTLMEFPCAIAIKAMGRNDGSFEELVTLLVKQHVGELPADAVRTRASTNGSYLAVTVQLQAQSRAQLDALYAALSEHPKVLMAL